MAAISIICFLGLQYIYWFGPSGYINIFQLTHKVHEQKKINTSLKEHNRLLLTEVQAFKNQTLDAVEARARRDLGMVAESEVFYFVDIMKSEKEITVPGQQTLRNQLTTEVK